MIIESEKIYLEIKTKSCSWQNAYHNQLETTTKTTMSYHLARWNGIIKTMKHDTTEKETPLLLAMWISLGIVDKVARYV